MFAKTNLNRNSIKLLIKWRAPNSNISFIRFERNADDVEIHFSMNQST